MTFDAALARHEASPPPWSTACLSGVRVLVKDFIELFAPDVVLLDIFMPPPDGFEMMSLIAQHSQRRATALVLMSGADSGLLDTATLFSIGRGIKPAAVLRKPVRLADILAVCMSHRRQHRALP